MKKVIIICIFSVCTICFATSTKEIKLNFDTSKFALENIGESTLFNYKDSRSRLVQYGIGSPVIPCVNIDVLMPSGAVYKNCRSKAKALALNGEYKIYTKKTGVMRRNKFSQYPPKLVEFVREKTINGCKVFSFRAYPITCIPGKGKVNKVIQTSFVIEYDIPSGDGLYSIDSANSLLNLKNIIVNPDDIRNMICNKSYGARLKSRSTDPLSKLRNSMIRDVCNEEGQDILSLLKSKSETPRVKKEKSFEDLIEENVYINDNNDIVFAPITF